MILALGVAAALAIGLSLPFVTSYARGPFGFWRGSPQNGFSGMMGYTGGYGYRGGMMGGGMMNGYWGQGNYQYMQNHMQYFWGNSTSTVVVMANDAFYPSTLSVSVGTTVTWINMDFVYHTVTSGSEVSPTSLFDSHELAHMQSFSFTFTTPGTYSYYYDIHPGMVGTITVT